MKMNWEEMSDQALADEAQLGLRGQGAEVEAMRRLREAMLKQQRSSNWLAGVMLFLAIIQTVSTVLQLYHWRL